MGWERNCRPRRTPPHARPAYWLRICLIRRVAASTACSGLTNTIAGEVQPMGEPASLGRGSGRSRWRVQDVPPALNTARAWGAGRSGLKPETCPRAPVRCPSVACEEFAELPRRDDADAFVRLEREEVLAIAGDEIVGFRLHRGRHDGVVFRIERHDAAKFG
jgi:hypothetical protein